MASVSELDSVPKSCKFNMAAYESDTKHKFIAVQILVHVWVAITSLIKVPWSLRPDLL
jgi:hypothetical protein